CHPKQPSKPSKLSYEGFEGGRTRHFLKNKAKEVYEATFDVLERLTTSTRTHWQQGVIDSRGFLVQWADKAAAWAGALKTCSVLPPCRRGRHRAVGECPARSVRA